MTAHEFKKALFEQDVFVEWSLIALYKEQTADEKETHSTNQQNGRGYNGIDAEFGTSLAEKLLKGDELSAKQIVAARKMLMKYVNQLTRLRNL